MIAKTRALPLYLSLLVATSASAQVVVPQVRVGDPQVRGALPAELVRRVVQRHLGEVRYCYERELAARPDLAGRVVVRFVVASTGDVAISTLASTTLHDAAVTDCIVAAVRRWQFPAQQAGGTTEVTYPMTLLVPPSPRHPAHGLSGR